MRVATCPPSFALLCLFSTKRLSYRICSARPLRSPEETLRWFALKAAIVTVVTVIDLVLPRVSATVRGPRIAGSPCSADLFIGRPRSNLWLRGLAIRVPIDGGQQLLCLRV